MPSWLYEAGNYGLVIFIAVTIVLGGLAAFVAGRALAQTWRSVAFVPAYALLLAAAVRFIHYSIFGEPLLSLRSYLVDYAILLALSSLGYAQMRSVQMRSQYGWLSAAGKG